MWNNNGSVLKDIKLSFILMDLLLYLKYIKKLVFLIIVNLLKLMSY